MWKGLGCISLRYIRYRRSWLLLLLVGVSIYFTAQLCVISKTMDLLTTSQQSKLIKSLHNSNPDKTNGFSTLKPPIYSKTLQIPSTGTTQVSKQEQDLNEDTLDEEEEIPEIPVFLGENPNYKVNVTSRNQSSLVMHYAGQLGNSMFAYASGYGISRRNWMRLLWPTHDLLRNYFHLEASEQDDLNPSHALNSLLEDAPNLYDDRTESLNHDIDIHLWGYYQSWRYFENYEKEIKRQFSFKSEIKILANDFLIQSYEMIFVGRSINIRDVTFVGVHIRRGDFLLTESQAQGYTVATGEYFETAMIYFMSMYDAVLFVVCSDDISWARRNLPRVQPGGMVFSTEHYVIEDLAILSLCNHTIMSVGTFGWWGGWLAGGKVLYYADFPRRNSPLSQAFDKRSFFPPHWKGLSFR